MTRQIKFDDNFKDFKVINTTDPAVLEFFWANASENEWWKVILEIDTENKKIKARMEAVE